MGIKIKLNEIEQTICSTMAIKRYNECREAGAVNKGHLLNHPLAMEVDGIGGELAVARHLKIYPNLDMGMKYGGCDLVSRTGVRIEIKTTNHKSGKILAQEWKKAEDSDIYILVTGQFPEFELAGWCYTKDLIKPENLIPQRQGKCYEWQHDDLRPMSEKPELDND